MNVIFVVTNEPTIARRYFDKYIDVEGVEFVTESVTNNVSMDIDLALTAWIEETSEDTFLHFINYDKLKDKKYNFCFVPYAGLVYAITRLMVGYNDIDTLVVCINEKIPTQAVSKQQFNILLNGKYYPPFSFFKTLMEKNGLLGNAFIDAIDNIDESTLEFLPAYYQTLVGH